MYSVVFNFIKMRRGICIFAIPYESFHTVTRVNCLHLADFLPATYASFSPQTFGRFFYRLFLTGIDFFSDIKCFQYQTDIKAQSQNRIQIMWGPDAQIGIRIRQ